MAKRSLPPSALGATHVEQGALGATHIEQSALGATHVADGPLADAGTHPYRAPALDIFNLGSELAGRYTYNSPDGADGAEIGRGGIGRVLLATDRHLEREVAIKELRLDLLPDAGASTEDAVRFLSEARITGQLEHPNIVPVYEIGRRADGRLYYTMRVVRGETLGQALARAKALPERLALLHHFSGLCNAIAYAHSRGVVHRDIKPDNVMIGEFGETIVLDWGIAKVRGQADVGARRAPEGVTAVTHTAHGEIVGTPFFMSPEQALGLHGEVDEQSDVWALGVVLYQLLAGKLPFAGKTLAEVVAQIAGREPESVRKLEPLAPPELAAVVERALTRDKSKRYASARELVRDVEAFMSGARVRAYDYTALDLLKRFYRRHRPAAVVAAVALVAMLALGVLLQRRILLARDRALYAEHVALEKELRARESLADVFSERALGARAEGDTLGAELFAARALSLSERADARGSVLGQTNRPDLVPLRAFEGASACSAWAASEHGLVACAEPGALVLFGTGEQAPRRLAIASAPRALALSADASTLVARADDGQVVVYRTQPFAEVVRWAVGGAGTGLLSLSRDGAFALASSGQVSELHRTYGGELVARRSLREPPSSQALAADGSLVALGGRLGSLLLWSADTGAEHALEGHRGTVVSLAFAPKAELLASGSADRSIALYNLATYKRFAPPLRELSTIESLHFSPSGRYLAFGSDDRMLGLLDVSHPDSVQRFRGHRGAVRLAAFTRDAELVSASSESGLSRWEFRAPVLPVELNQKANVLALAFADSARLLSAGLAADGVCVWNVAAERCAARLPVSDGQVRALAVHPASERLIVGLSSGRILGWNLATTLPESVLEAHRGAVRSLEFSPDGDHFLSSGEDGQALYWQLGQSRPSQRFNAAAGVQDALLDVGLGRVLLATRAGELEEWSASGERRRTIPAHEGWIMDLAVHAARDRLVTVGADGNVLLWGYRQLTLQATLGSHEGRVLSADFDPSGEILATSGEDDRVLLWRVHERRLLARLVHHKGSVRAVRFSPDGRYLASGGDDGNVRLWDLSRLNTPGQTLLDAAQERYHVALDGAQITLK
jgi:eukaryotic-like serine/threonine-protein kinase